MPIVAVFVAFLMWWPQMAQCQSRKAGAPANQTDGDKKPIEPTHVVIDGPLPTVRAEIKADEQKQGAVEKPLLWFLRPEWVIVYVTALYAGIALWTLFAIKGQAETMEQQLSDARTSSAQQAADVQASIAEAVRSATAMEGVAVSMASNVESVRQSVAISREIADTQKIAIELQSRPYLSAFINTARYQDANNVFEVQVVLRNHGNTPAYDVAFRAAAGIIPTPIPEEFSYPLGDDSAGTSTSLLAPGATKLITRFIRERVPDDQVEAIKRGLPPRSLAMWGIVHYRDAFNKTRKLKFAFTVDWIGWIPGMDKDERGNPKPEQVMSRDTAHHNEAD